MRHKYRAWDKKWAQWILPRDISFWGEMGWQFDRRDKPDGDIIETTDLLSGEIDLEQFTGLRDKNGDEVDWWDGDLLRKGSDHPNAPIGIIAYNERRAQWVLGSMGAGTDFCSLATAYECEWKKFGTIHEHPELLKK